MMMNQTESKSDDDSELNNWQQFWQDKLRKNDEYITSIAVSGFKYALIAHATVLITCLNGYVASEADKFRPAMLGVMFAALLGIALSMLGQVIFVETLSHFNEEVRGQQIRSKGWKSVLAPAVYGDRFLCPNLKWSARLIYGSAIWLVLYLFAGLVALGST